MSEAQKPIAYLKFWAYQQVTQDGNVNADEGLEVCREGEIGMDGVKAIPVYDTPQEAKINADLLEALRLAVLQNSHDMVMTSEEIRICESAITKATKPVSAGVE